MSSKKRASTSKKPRSPKAVKAKKEVVKAAGAAAAKKTRKPRVAKNTGPKRPKSAYILFLSDHRDRIIKENPGITFTEIPRVASTEWRSLKPAQKAKYEKLALTDRERYKDQMLSYVPSPEDKEQKRRKKAGRSQWWMRQLKRVFGWHCSLS